MEEEKKKEKKEDMKKKHNKGHVLGLEVWKKSEKKIKRKEDSTREKKRSVVGKRGEKSISIVLGKEFETNLFQGKQSMSPIADLGEQQSL